jgi:predicted nucleotidyltransferase
MNRDEIIAKLKENAAAIRAEGVTKLAIFGSRARGDARRDSDLDVLIEVNDTFRGLSWPAVASIVEQVTGLPAQVTLRRSLDPRIAERIADDVIEVF